MQMQLFDYLTRIKQQEMLNLKQEIKKEKKDKNKSLSLFFSGICRFNI